MAQTTTTGTLVADSAAHGGGHKKAFPPMDPATFASQLVWLALTFGTLYLIMSRISLPRIGQVIEERRDRIQRDLDEAERLKTETETALSQYEQSLSEARARSSAIAQEERAKVTSELESERLAADEQTAKKLDQAESQIAASRAKALESVNEIAAGTAGTIIDKLIGAKVGADEIKKALGA